MSKKDYIAIAKELNKALKRYEDKENCILYIADGLIEVFEKDNPDFNLVKFKKAVLDA